MKVQKPQWASETYIHIHKAWFFTSCLHPMLTKKLLSDHSQVTTNVLHPSNQSVKSVTRKSTVSGSTSYDQTDKTNASHYIWF